MNAPAVSVIMPAYNAERWIGAAIDSALAQTRRDLEVLVADDRSTDGTAAVVEGRAARDPRVRLLRHEKNAGPAAARNTALRAAAGRYVAFLDSDDLWLEDKLRLQLEFMERTGAALSYTSYRRIGEDGAPVSGEIRIPESLDYAGLLKNTAIATSTVVLDRDRTGPLEMPVAYYDDFVLWLSLLKRGLPARGLPADLMRYRVVEGSVSRRKWKSAREVWKTYRRIEKLSWPYSAWCFVHYAINALRKYR